MSEYRSLVFPRIVLLIEIDRRCTFADCNARNFIGLTKPEAGAFSGFECQDCGRWNDAGLSEKDVPEWWREITERDAQ
jgi:hypothetical protein